MGGQCVVCAYSRCTDGLAFHHLDPSLKEIAFSEIRANPKSWDKIVRELRKCVLVCNNCHAEIHAGMTPVPFDAPRFDEAYASVERFAGETHTGTCPVCERAMRPTNQTCSKRCAGLRKARTDWSQYDLREMMRTMTLTEIAATIGVHLATVSKRVHKLGLK